MKFKIATLSLLIAIFTICLLAAHTLISTTNKQLELQKIQLEIELEQYELDHKVIYYDGDSAIRATETSAWWRNEISKIYEEK